MIGGKETQFKPGHKPENTTYDGCIKIRKIKDGTTRKFVRVSNMKWRELQLVLFEQKYGVSTKGKVLRCKSADRLNCDPSNWELLSKSENLKKNKNYEKVSNTKKAKKRTKYLREKYLTI